MSSVDLSTPMLWYPGQSQEEFDDEFNLMMARARATADLLNGTIHPDTFLDLLADQHFDVLELGEEWFPD